MGSTSDRGAREAAGRQSRPQARTVIRADSISEMLGALPVLFGFQPQESLVVVVLEGPRQRMGFGLRLDLPPSEHCDAAACQVADVVRAQAGRAVLLVALTRDADRADALVAACTDRLTLDGVLIVDAVRCDGRRYWCYGCVDPRCCPPEGRPYDINTSAALAQAVLEGVEVLPDRSALAARLAPVTGATRTRMQAATTRVVADITSLSDDVPEEERTRVLSRAGVDRVKPILARAATDPMECLTDLEVAQLSVWCSLIVVRDVAWAQMTRDDAEHAFALWSQVARRVLPPFEPAVLSLAGFAAWLKGDGASAWCAVERAEAADPDYSMMRLLRETLLRAVPPTCWQQLDEAEVWAVLDG